MSSTLVTIKLVMVWFDHKMLELYHGPNREVGSNPKNKTEERPQAHLQSQIPGRNPLKMIRMRKKRMKTNHNWQISLTRAQRKLQENLCQTRADRKRRQRRCTY